LNSNWLIRMAHGGSLKMATAFRVLTKQTARRAEEGAEVSSIAEQLRDYMTGESVCSAIRRCHQLHGTSQQIQEVLNDKLLQLGFHNEKRGLFSNYPVASLRPDFYRKVGTSGILLEIERGKTITNNMDLLDLWKCHLCSTADFLFLVVPNERPSENGQVIPPSRARRADSPPSLNRVIM
jgi:hypothetical protein